MVGKMDYDVPPMPEAPRLPYFDMLLEGRRRGDPASEVLSRFVHWGFWENPALADRDPAAFSDAMERLNAELLREAGLADGQAVLDAGCGFGGTLAAVDAAYADMRLAGLNIDPRQLAVARETVVCRPGNSVSFVVGDATAMPLPSGAFERVLAVECIFHFPSRLAFLREAARVLKPGGKLVLSDFVPRAPGGPPTWWGRWLGEQVAAGYGVLGSGWPDGDYAAMARQAGLELVLDRDITAHTLPTYPVMQDLIARGRGERAAALRRATRVLEWCSRLGMIRYRVVAFSK